jgi:hypothetical protein
VKNIAVELHGTFTRDDGSHTNVTAKISEPVIEKAHGDWRSTVECPFLFTTNKQIIGADKKQAVELAEKFARNLLQHNGVKDVVTR